MEIYFLGVSNYAIIHDFWTYRIDWMCPATTTNSNKLDPVGYTMATAQLRCFETWSPSVP